MTDARNVVILGGHGKVALLAAARLAAAGFAVDSVIRDPDQGSDVEQAGGRPVVLDIQSASVDDLARLFAGAEAIVFAAGAGGKGPPERTRAVDHDAAVRTMQAAEQAGVKRYVMVSYANARDHYRELGPDHDFYPYAKAKHDADAHLRQTALEYTILGPGSLTLEPATGKLQVADEHGQVDGNWPNDNMVTSRDNVAAVIAEVISAHAAVRQTVNFYDGDVGIIDALTA